MTKYVHCRVIDSKPQQPAGPCGYAIVPRPSKPDPVLNFLTRRYGTHPDPSCGSTRQLDMLA